MSIVNRFIEENPFYLYNSWKLQVAGLMKWTGMLYFEFFGVISIILKGDITFFDIQPFSLELHYPDYLSGLTENIDDYQYDSCRGGYFNMELMKSRFSIHNNINRCGIKVSNQDTDTGDAVEFFERAVPDSVFGCYFDEDSETEPWMPTYWDGLLFKIPYWQNC